MLCGVISRDGTRLILIHSYSYLGETTIEEGKANDNVARTSRVNTSAGVVERQHKGGQGEAAETERARISNAGGRGRNNDGLALSVRHDDDNVLTGIGLLRRREPKGCEMREMEEI